jgi:toluene monooxygenase electron transfer component
MPECVVKLIKGPDLRVDTGDNLLRTALRQGMGFPYECTSGGCGSCQFELLKGEVACTWEDAPGLSPEARRAGRHLACQSRVLTDCEIKVRLKPQYVASIRPAVRTVRYLGRRPLTADMAEYSFRESGAADFLPGQYALLSLPGVTGDRAYSMSNLPNPDGLWRFIIKRVPDGKGSGCVESELQVGDEITLDGPYGIAHLRPESRRDVVCIGGGSGLSPMKSILSAAVREPRLSDRNIWLLYGGRTPSDICIDQVLDEDPSIKARVKVVTAISSAEQASGWSGKTGFIHTVLDELLGGEEGMNAADCEFYFCGPPPMTDAVQRMLLMERKVPTQQLHFDRFI